jgi:hypothetical protein
MPVTCDRRRLPSLWLGWHDNYSPIAPPSPYLGPLVLSANKVPVVQVYCYHPAAGQLLICQSSRQCSSSNPTSRLHHRPGLKKIWQQIQSVTTSYKKPYPPGRVRTPYPYIHIFILTPLCKTGVSCALIAINFMGHVFYSDSVNTEICVLLRE